MKEQILNAIEGIIDARNTEAITEIQVVIYRNGCADVTATSYKAEKDSEEDYEEECECENKCECEKKKDIEVHAYKCTPGELDEMLKKLIGKDVKIQYHE